MPLSIPTGVNVVGVPSSGQVPQWNGSAWVPVTGAYTFRKTTAKIVNTTVAATDLLNGEVTIPAAAMGATGIIRLTASGDHLNNSGGAVVFPRFQLVFGGTTIFDTAVDTTGTAGNSATRGGWRIQAEITNLTASSQVASIVGFLASITAFGGAGTPIVFATGEGVYHADNVGHIVKLEGFNTGLAVNTANAAALVLNVINGSASATYETKLASALVEII